MPLRHASRFWRAVEPYRTFCEGVASATSHDSKVSIPSDLKRATYSLMPASRSAKRISSSSAETFRMQSCLCRRSVLPLGII